ncbi:MAG TPA: hypothetical protein VJT32_02815 [bacterium]|nr:hypothetical protein [bacterium]
MRTSIGGKYYYGDVLGLTGSSGQIFTGSEKIMRDFDQDQQLFPADYVQPLSACDSVVELRILSQAEVEKRSVKTPATAMVAGEVRSMYAQARNHQVKPTTTSVDFSKVAYPFTIAVSAEPSGVLS